MNGYLAESVQNWMDCLDALRDPRLRRRIGECARESVSVRFSKEEQARRLVEALKSVLQHKPLDGEIGGRRSWHGPELFPPAATVTKQADSSPIAR